MITYPTQIDTSSTIAIATNLKTQITAEIYNTLREAVIAIENELGVNPSQEFGTVKDRLDNLAGSLIDFTNATSDAIANTISKRDDFGNSNFNSIGLNSNGQIKFSVSSTDVIGITCDSSKNIIIGTNAESITIEPDTDKNINISISGTGALSLNMNDTNSVFSLISNSIEILHAENGLLQSPQYSSLNGTPASVGLFAASAADFAILTTKNSTDNDMNLISVVSDQIRIGSTLAAGYRFISGASTNYSFFSGINTILNISDTGIQFPANFTFASITQGTSGFGNRPNLTLEAASGNVSLGGQGSDLILSVGSAGTGSDVPGDIYLKLKNSGDLSGILRVSGGSFGDLITIQYDNSVPAVNTNINYNLEMLGLGYVTIRSFDDDLTIGCGNSKSIFLSYGAGLTTRIQIDSTGIGFLTAPPVARQNITGSRGGNAALASLLTGFANFGLITDNTTA